MFFDASSQSLGRRTSDARMTVEIVVLLGKKVWAEWFTVAVGLEMPHRSDEKTGRNSAGQSGWFLLALSRE